MEYVIYCLCSLSMADWNNLLNKLMACESVKWGEKKNEIWNEHFCNQINVSLRLKEKKKNARTFFTISYIIARNGKTSDRNYKQRTNFFFGFGCIRDIFSPFYKVSNDLRPFKEKLNKNLEFLKKNNIIFIPKMKRIKTRNVAFGSILSNSIFIFFLC